MFSAQLAQMVKIKGGAIQEVIAGLLVAPFRRDIVAETSGYIAMNAELVAASVALGAGREEEGDPIDPAAGILESARPAIMSKEGDVIATLLTGGEVILDEGDTSRRLWSCWRALPSWSRISLLASRTASEGASRKRTGSTPQHAGQTEGVFTQVRSAGFYLLLAVVCGQTCRSSAREAPAEKCAGFSPPEAP